MQKLTIFLAFLLAISSCTKEVPCPQAPASDPGYYSNDDGGDNSDDNSDDNSSDNSNDNSNDDSGDDGSDNSGDDGNRYQVHQHTSQPGTTITNSQNSVRQADIRE